MNEIRQIVIRMKSHIEDIEAELDMAENKGVFSYPRSKNVRKAALELRKDSGFVRELSQELFKATEQK